MRVHIFTFTWNEAPLVPYFLRHYLPWVDRIVVYDHESTDGTPEMLAAYSPRVEVRSFSAPHYPEPEPLGRLRAECWREAKGHADWAVVIDFDEFLYHPAGVPAFLAKAYSAGYTLVKTFGWQMVHEEFPPPHVSLTEWAPDGVPRHWYSKPIVFRPEQFTDIRWEVGCHQIYGSGNVRELASGSLALLHYKYIGRQRLVARYAAYRQRMADAAHASTLGHYHVDPDKLDQEFDDLLSRAVRVTW